MTLTDNDEAGKVFVGGLSWETTKENLEQYFGKFGEVIDSVVMKNNVTGRSRGFGFVTFNDPSVVQSVLASGPHALDGKTIDPKACTPRSLNRVSGVKSESAKLFLGGLSPDISEDDLREAFSKFGKVYDVTIMFDQEKKKSRGFGFLSFESEDSTQLACDDHYVEVKGKQIECKLAIPREEQKSYGRGRGRGNQFGGDSSWGGGGNRRGPDSAGWQPSAMPDQAAMGYGGGGWGVVPQQQAFGAAGVPAYGGGYSNFSAQPPSFGSAPPSSGYGAPSSGYGSTAAPGGYGSSGPTGGYGSAVPAGGFGSSAPVSGYGTPTGMYDPSAQSAGYGSAPPSGGYGSSAQPGGYGTSAKPSGYGMAYATSVTSESVYGNYGASEPKSAPQSIPTSYDVSSDKKGPDAYRQETSHYGATKSYGSSARDDVYGNKEDYRGQSAASSADSRSSRGFPQSYHPYRR